MPTYEYECQECGLRFEKLQNMSAPRLKTCPDCGGPVKRLIGTGAAVIVKGSGSHAADYGGSRTRCSRERPCCGREVPCDMPPCDE